MRIAALFVFISFRYYTYFPVNKVRRAACLPRGGQYGKFSVCFVRARFFLYANLPLSPLGVLHKLGEKIVLCENIGNSDKYHSYAPELRGSYRADELAPVIVAQIFYIETPDAVSYRIKRKVVIEFKPEIQQSHNPRKYEKKGHFKKLDGYDVYARMARTGQPPIGLLSVAAAAEEAAQTPEAVRYGYAYWNKGKRVGERGVHFARQKLYFGAGTDDVHIKVPYRKEAYHSPYKSADKGHTVEVERALIDEVVNSLKQSG